MSECRRFLEMEVLRDDARLYGQALSEWQSHLTSCAMCLAQQGSSSALRSALGSEPAPRLTANFAARTLQAAHDASKPAPRLNRAARVMLALNWLVAASACILLAIAFPPFQSSGSNLAFKMTTVFALSATLFSLLHTARKNQGEREVRQS